jgi:lysophospholipase L1-like esterase
VQGGGRAVFVLGDSVLLGVRDTLPAALPGWVVTVDTVGSRRLPQGIEVLQARRGEIGAVVVIMLGNNYLAGEGSYAAQIDQAMRVLTGVSRVVWLTVGERWASRVEINAAIRAAPSRWPTIVVADWAVQVAAHPEYAEDMLHLSPSGRAAMRALIAATVGPAPA